MSVRLLRRFHASTNTLKNPYFFYDLQRQQGPGFLYSQQHLAAEQARQAAEANRPKAITKAADNSRRIFDPNVGRPQESMESRVGRVFGAMGSRDESRKEAQLKGITVAGINVPARPEEPTNCCMSGCINCVWELYKDEFEEYKGLRTEARNRLSDPKYDSVAWPLQLGIEPSQRMARRSGMKTAAAENQEDEDDDGLDEGIRVFIATERKLHKKKQAQATA